MSVSYSNATASLYTASTIQPQLDGFEGYEAHCGLTSGSMPAGMRLNDDCTISGRPTEAGRFFFNFKVTAEDADGSAEGSSYITVAAPTPAYPIQALVIGSSVKIGDAVHDLPSVDNVNGWRAPIDGTVLTWTYQLSGGALPPGLALDPATGAVSGTATTAGDYGASLKVTLTTKYGSYVANANYDLSVGMASLSYIATGAGYVNASYITTFLSQPFSASPTIGGYGGMTNFVAGSVQLPAGLSLDLLTGVISGTPTATRSGLLPSVSVTVTSAGVAYTATGLFTVSVNDPVSVGYPATSVAHGTYVTVAPVVTQYSPIPVTGATYAYDSTSYVCRLPPGATLDPTSGVVSGIPTNAGSYACTLKVTVTNNGVSWSRSTSIAMTVQ